jgi:hypothetical protein
MYNLLCLHDLARDKGPWRALVITVMNFLGPYNAGKLARLPAQLTASREGQSSMWLVTVLEDVHTYSSKQLLNCTHEAEWTPFQTHCFSDNLVVPGIEPGPLDL